MKWKKTSSNLQEKTPTTRRVGGRVGGQAMANGNKKSEQSHGPCDIYPCILAPRLPDVCEKTFSTSFVPQPAENNTYKSHTNMIVHCVMFGEKIEFEVISIT